MFFVYTYILNQHHNFVNSFIYKLPINCIFIQIDTAKFVAEKQKKPQTKRLRLRKHSGRGRRIRTLGTRFWRPLLYQLSYTPMPFHITPPASRALKYNTKNKLPCQAFAPKIRKVFACAHTRHVSQSQLRKKCVFPPARKRVYLKCKSLSAKPRAASSEKGVYL